MIVGGYSLDLYCGKESQCKAIGKSYEDKAGNRFEHYEPVSDSYSGVSLSACRKQALRDRWRFTQQDVICRYCTGRVKQAGGTHAPQGKQK